MELSHQRPKLLDQVRNKIRLKHYSIRTETAYVGWIKRFIFFHNKTHPEQMGPPEIEAFLTDLACQGNVAPSTQNQAFHALLFLYNEVLDIPLKDKNIQAVRAKTRERVPVVLTQEEVKAVIQQLSGVYQIMAKLMYGGGLRILECMRLRIKDIDFNRLEIHLLDTKSLKDRITFLPPTVVDALQAHLSNVKILHQQDLERGWGEVYLPHALDRKYPNAAKEWQWQYVFPSKSISIDPRSGKQRRHHLHESSFNKELKKAVRQVEIYKKVTAHTLRHYAEFQIMPSKL